MKLLYDLLVAPFADFLFMKRALLGGLALSLSAPPVGVFLVIRRMSMVADAMTHAILPGAAIGYLIAGLSTFAMTIGGFVTSLIVAFLSAFTIRMTSMKEDASFAAFHLMALAVGILIISLQRSQTDLLHILFGNILALDNSSFTLLLGASFTSLAGLSLVFRPLVIDSLDPQFLRLVSPWSFLVHPFFLLLVILNLIAGFYALGTLMAVGMMIFPPISAQFWSYHLRYMIPVSILISAFSLVIGLLFSYHLDLPSGPSIILVAALVYVFSLLTGSRGGLLSIFPVKKMRSSKSEVINVTLP